MCPHGVRGYSIQYINRATDDLISAVLALSHTAIDSHTSNYQSWRLYTNSLKKYIWQLLFEEYIKSSSRRLMCKSDGVDIFYCLKPNIFVTHCTLRHFPKLSPERNMPRSQFGQTSAILNFSRFSLCTLAWFRPSFHPVDR